MRWRLFATLAEAAGETTVEAPPAVDGEGTVGMGDRAGEIAGGRADVDVTVGDALAGLLDAYPALEDEVLDAEGELADHVRLLIDGSDPTVDGEGLDAPVEPDAELALFPPVSGG